MRERKKKKKKERKKERKKKGIENFIIQTTLCIVNNILLYDFCNLRTHPLPVGLQAFCICEMFTCYKLDHRPIRLTQCCTQFRSLGVKILCALYLHYKVAFTFKWYGNSWNKTFYSQVVWIGYNIELAELVYLGS